MPDDPLVALALRLTDGESIDWKAESEFASVDLSLLQRLEQIEAVARAHEGVDTTNQRDVSPRPVGGPFWGHLEIIELIGSGSYGDVYRARDTRLGREVALKLLRKQGAPESNSSSVVREGYLLSRVRHANVVTVYGADCLDGQTGLWMELIEGETLEQEVQRRGALDAAEVAQMGAVISDALEAVHSAGLLHRDVKAQNVMRDRARRLVLMDFGSGNDVQRFAHSTVEGTPLYAAPEVLNGGEASVRSDIYSLGVLLWRLLTASYPVNGRSVDEIKRAHALGRIAKGEDAGAGGDVARVVATCLAIDAGKRPPTAGELGRRLRACGQPSGLYRRSARNWTGLSVFAAAVLLLSTAPLSLSFKGDARSLLATGEPVWRDPGGIPSGAPTADGHYFACQGFQIPVGICDVTTGIMQRVPITERWREVYNARPLISPDGQRVAYHGLEFEEAKIVDLSTSTSKSLKVDPSFFLKISSWRPSGDSLLVVLSPNGVRPLDGRPRLSSSVALLDINTRTLTDLKQFDATPEDVALSHDGRHLAFTQGGALFISDLPSGETRQIAGASNVHGALAWIPGDDGVFFTSSPSRRRASELQLVRLTDGWPVGQIQVLWHSSASYSSLLGISDTGDVYYNVGGSQATTLYIAAFDALTRQIGLPAAVAMLPSSFGMDWSPDSLSIAYASSDETKTFPTLVIRNVATSVERELQLPEDSSGGVRIIRWSPQGSILASAFHNYLVHLDEALVTRSRIGEETLARCSSVEWSPEGSRVLCAGVDSVRGFDVETSLETESYTLSERVSSAQVSPRQRLVAFSKPPRFEIDVVALDDGVPGPLLVSDRRCRPVGWWNREVFVACDDDSKVPNLSSLYLVDVAGGTTKAISVNLQQIGSVRVRPDDRAIAITAGRTPAGTFVLKLPRK